MLKRSDATFGFDGGDDLLTCFLSLWSVSALPVPHREEGEARGGREGQEGKELTKSREEEKAHHAYLSPENRAFIALPAGAVGSKRKVRGYL